MRRLSFAVLWHLLFLALCGLCASSNALASSNGQENLPPKRSGVEQLPYGNHTTLYAADSMADVEIVEALTPATPLSSTSASARRARQLFYEPNLIFVSSVGVTAVAEGGKCVTAHGQPGSCLRIGQCSNYATFDAQQRQVAATFFTDFQPWIFPPPPAAVPAGRSSELCTFYDQLGRVNGGVCCTLNDVAGGGEFGFGLWPSPLPIPAPPAAVPAKPAQPPQGAGESELDDDSGEQQRPVRPGNENDPEVNADADIDAQMSADFPDDNSIIYDPIKDEEGGFTRLPAATPTQPDYRQQWTLTPGQQFGFGPGSFGLPGAVPQWPPALPTHPPGVASWPPPIPTHPPNHHYPTHPPSGAVTTTRRPPAVTTTPPRRPPPTTVPPTTTRRPAAYPGYPTYPGFPAYPTYPTQRPAATQRPGVVVTKPPPATITTTTTRRPTAGTGGGTSAYGLPLQCGVKNPTSPDQERIVGGTNASPYEFPWIVVLFKAGKQFCGGSLITNTHVLTAAHCVARMTSWDVAALTVHLGDYNIRTDFEVKHVERRVKRLVRHKGFDFSHLHNDIAILTLSEPVKFNHEIQPICLPTSTTQQSRSYSGHLATVAGWGSLRENGPQPSVLQKVQIPIWSNAECARKYGRAAPGGIIESMVCAGTIAKDSCSGDSGGPMIVKDDGGRYTQVGIVSWGIGCGKGQYPGVYTRVTALLSWIYKNIKM